MLPKKNRAGKKAVERIFREGKFVNSPSLVFKFVIDSQNIIPRISFIAPKSVAKNAVQRNSLRRRGYVALEKYLDKFPAGLFGAFVFKKYQDDISIIENEIKTILNKIN